MQRHSSWLRVLWQALSLRQGGTRLSFHRGFEESCPMTSHVVFGSGDECSFHDSPGHRTSSE